MAEAGPKPGRLVLTERELPLVNLAAPQLERRVGKARAAGMGAARTAIGDYADTSVVQPAAEAPATQQTAPATSTTTAAPTSGEAAPGEGAPAVDIDALARQVYQILCRRLRVERERARGGNR